MTLDDHEKQHRFAEIVSILEDYIEATESKLAFLKRELLWWKKRTKKDLNVEL